MIEGKVKIHNMTAEDVARGYYVCDCGKYVYVFRASILAQLRPTDVGKLCAECGAFMVPIDALKEAGFNVAAKETSNGGVVAINNGGVA